MARVRPGTAAALALWSVWPSRSDILVPAQKQPVQRVQYRRPLNAEALAKGHIRPDLARQVRVSSGYTWKPLNVRE
ncbi:hypothetical protein [Acetobacter papayae]|uniref:hypothetical protein n=1 Tax=Acetobacter papayae TaxID=1076592 RepID=UPI0039E90842